MAINIEQIIGRCNVDQTGELLQAAWDAANDEQRHAFIDANKDQLQEWLEE